MEIGGGINYWDGQSWTASDPSFDVSSDGYAFVANRLCYKVRLQADNLNVPGAITITTPDGKILKSTPIAIGLYDAASGQSMILVGITNCPGVLVSSNKVVYENAFNGNGVRASVVCVAERGAFTADIVLTSQLNPTDYSFPASTTRIQMITEYYDPPVPERIRTVLRVETDPLVRQSMVTPDLIDETLGFGELVFGRAHAYRIGNANTNLGAVVVKEFKTVDERTFLVESVEYPAIRKELLLLPQFKPNGASLRPKRHREYAKIPAAGKNGRSVPWKRSRTEMASLKQMQLKGVCIDPWQPIQGTLTGLTVFQADTTYYVSQPVYCNGPVIIEGGAVFKYPNSTGSNPTTTFIELNNTLTCATAMFRPAVFTARDDDSVGVKWTSSSGNPNGTYYANPAILMPNFLSLSNCRFRYAKVAIECDAYDLFDAAQVTIAHSQFVNCIQGISIIDFTGGCAGTGLSVTFNNALMAGVTYPLEFSTDSSDSAVSVQLNQCTIANAVLLKGPGTGCYVTFNSVNSIFANVGGWSADLASGVVTMEGDYNGFYPSTAPHFGTHYAPVSTSPFQSPVGGGNYYLKSDSSFRGAGSTSIDLTAIRQRTTQPPPSAQIASGSSFSDDKTFTPDAGLRDTGPTVDLGYHYDPIDWALANCTAQGAAMIVAPGTVIATYATSDANSGKPGLTLDHGSQLICVGTPTQAVWIVEYNTVQESPGTWQRTIGGSVASGIL